MRVAFLLLLATASAGRPWAQPLGSAPRVYGAVGLAPGLGAVVGTTRPVGVVAAEAALSVDVRFVGTGRVLTSLGLGGSVRLVRIAESLPRRGGQGRRATPAGTDLDVGLRIGPSFYAAFGEPTAASEARAFGVMSDAFARASRRTPSGRVVFVEVGTQAPAVRAGLTTAFGGRVRR